MDIHTPLSRHSSPKGPNVMWLSPFPRPPCPPWHRKISHLPEHTPPNPGGSPHSQAFVHPSFSNQATLCAQSETFKIGVSPFASMGLLQVVSNNIEQTLL